MKNYTNNKTMSCYISAYDLTDTLKKKMLKELILSSDTGGQESIELFDVEHERKTNEGELIHLPFAWARNNCDIKKLSSLPSNASRLMAAPAVLPPPAAFGGEKQNPDFHGNLRPEQVDVNNSALKNLEETGSVIISARPGFGKTIIAINLICTLNTPTLIFIKQVEIVNQWKTALKTYAPHKKVVHLSSTKQYDKTGDVYIVNPILFKDDNNKFFFSYHKLETLQRVKCVIVDELHQQVSKKTHKAFFKVSPDYLIGLSATPYRPKDDPLGKAISLFFGDRCVKTSFYRKHIVYLVKTQFNPPFKINKITKQIDWNFILNEQALNRERNDLIVNIIKQIPNRVWLILVKRVEHAKILSELLNEQNLDNCTFTGVNKTFNKNTTILIGTTSKVGTGFDHAPIDALIVASDCVEYFEQFLGRCMRRPDVVPIIIDFEDKSKLFKKHLQNRIAVYTTYGGVIKSEADLSTAPRCAVSVTPGSTPEGNPLPSNAKRLMVHPVSETTSPPKVALPLVEGPFVKQAVLGNIKIPTKFHIPSSESPSPPWEGDSRQPLKF